MVQRSGECGRGARIERDPRGEGQRDYKLGFHRYGDASGVDHRVTAGYHAVNCAERNALIYRMPKRWGVFFAVLDNREFVAQMRHRMQLRRILREQQGEAKYKL